jgi:hypothetical protein
MQGGRVMQRRFVTLDGRLYPLLSPAERARRAEDFRQQKHEEYLQWRRERHIKNKRLAFQSRTAA